MKKKVSFLVQVKSLLPKSAIEKASDALDVFKARLNQKAKLKAKDVQTFFIQYKIVYPQDTLNISKITEVHAKLLLDSATQGKNFLDKEAVKYLYVIADATETLTQAEKDSPTPAIQHLFKLFTDVTRGLKRV